VLFVGDCFDIDMVVVCVVDMVGLYVLIGVSVVVDLLLVLLD